MSHLSYWCYLLSKPNSFLHNLERNLTIKNWKNLKLKIWFIKMTYSTNATFATYTLNDDTTTQFATERSPKSTTIILLKMLILISINLRATNCIIKTYRNNMTATIWHLYFLMKPTKPHNIVKYVDKNNWIALLLLYQLLLLHFLPDWLLVCFCRLLMKWEVFPCLHCFLTVVLYLYWLRNC